MCIRDRMTSYWAVAGSFLTNIVDKFNFKSEDDVKTRLFVLACVVIPQCCMRVPDV